MFRLTLLTIFLISSPVFSLLETLYEAEHRCSSGCVSHYGHFGFRFNACKRGEFIRYTSREKESEIEDYH